MIPDDVVERVREQADIVAIVGELVKLKRVGNSHRGPCPFHQGKDANFSVSPKGGYVCFVCHEKGDVFTFVQKRLGLDFVDAVKYVGAKAGVEVPEVSRARAEGPDPRERFWEVNAAAAEFFARTLWSDVGSAAQEYLAGRTFDRAAAERFGLGFAPRDGAAMRAHLETLGYDTATLVTAGLLVVREEGEEPRVRFRGRLMFPIYDAQGRTIAFGGRVIGEGEPKYLNSAESPTFQKGSTLYGLNWAKQAIRRDEHVMLVEGYFDCVRLIAAGVECVVAPLGTALTEPQADLIRKYTPNVFLLYDSDKAGLKATFRAGDVLLRRGCKVSVMTLPEGEDPDTFVARHGGEKLTAQLSTAIDVFERKLQILQRGGWLDDLRHKREALDRLLPTLRSAADPITRSLYLARAAEVVGVAQDVLERELQSTADRKPSPEPAPARPSAATRVPRPERARRELSAGGVAERELVRVVLHRRNFISHATDKLTAARLDAAAFRVAPLRLIFTALTADADADPDGIAATLDESGVAMLNELFEHDGGLDDPARVIDDCVAAFRRRELEERIDDINREQTLASDVEKNKLLREKQELTDQLRGLGGRRWKSFAVARPQSEERSET